MRSVFGFCILVMFISCNEKKTAPEISTANSTQSDSVKPRYKVDSLFVENIIDSLYTLDLVKDAIRRNDSANMFTVRFAFLPDSMAYGNDELYIGAGESHLDRFVTYLNFYVNTKTKQIRLYDAIKDDTVDIKTYEERVKNAVNN